MPVYIVDTIQTFRHRYVIECDSLEHAYDTVVCNGSPDNFEPFSQMDLGENIVDGREITIDEFNRLNKNLETSKTELGNPWMGEKMIYKVKYDRREQHD